jgi:adenine-specific DNA-methyltransferase
MPTLNFKGKSVVRTHHLTLPYRQLTPIPAKSLTFAPGLNDNLVVHGDNLLALKALMPSFSGKIKCIYIDPPYNTGNENWVYNDNVNSPMHNDWLKKTVDRDDLTRHDKWLCMIWPRLTLLRDLLAEDGAIFISIDDNEVHHLRAVMDEIFGEENFVADVTVVNNLKGRSDDRYIATAHEHLLIYRKSNDYETFGIPVPEEYQDEYGERDESGEFYRLQGLRKRGSNSRREDRPNMYYPFYYNPDAGILNLDKKSSADIEIRPKLSSGEDGCWRWGKDTASKRIDELVSRKVEGRDEYDVFQKDYLFIGGDLKTIKPKSIWLSSLFSTDTGTRIYKSIMGQEVFTSPKSPYLIMDIIKQATRNGDIILDSFAGSGTTAHAVLALNAEDEDGGGRKFILIEQEDYADTVTAERVRRVIRGVPNAKDEKLKAGLGGSFTYLEMGAALDDESVLSGAEMPAYIELAQYAFFTATGEKLDLTGIDESRWYLGESRQYQVYLLYKPDIEFLKENPLNLEFAREKLPPFERFVDKPRLVIASHKYVDDFRLQEMGIEFCQLPFSIYKFRAK